MSEEVKNENENIEEGEIVELDEPTPEPEEAVQESEPEQVEESVQEAAPTEEEELAGYSDKVQKRINTLTRKLREAERASESAYNMANSLKTENNNLKERVAQSSESFLGEAEQRLQSQRVQAQAALKNALETQDHDKAVKAQDILARIAVEESSIKNSKINFTQNQNVKETPAAQPEQQPAQPDPKAQAWADANVWFGEDRVMTMATFGIHEDLVDEGFDPNSDEYYTEVDQRLRKSFPAKFEKAEESVTETQKPQQRVASAARNTQATGGKRKVKLTPSEVQMAKKLNVPLNEYAKFVKR
tara:strand:- start:1128 stop:2033 length:906 start_codon:yes stop_codon:yes gene_type:complete